MADENLNSSGGESPGSATPPPPPAQSGAAKENKILVGILAILLGALGIHKFILGYKTEGIIMLCITVLTCSLGAFIPAIIGLIEGIIYLTKTDQDYYQTYVAGQKKWF